MPKEEKVINEFGSTDADSLYIVTKSFFLRVKNGPLQRMEPGQTVRATRETGSELFAAAKVEPVKIPEVFTVLRPFQVVGEDGHWVHAAQGDVIRLSPSESIGFLRQGLIREEESK